VFFRFKTKNGEVRGRIISRNAFGNSSDFGIHNMFLGFKLYNPKKGIF